MGEIRVRMFLENEGDLYLHDRRKLSRKKVRMEELDLVPDPLLKTLTPRPESPFLPTLKMKSLARATPPTA